MSSYRIWRLAVRNLQHRRTALTNVGTRIVVSILPQRLTLPCRKLQGSLVHGGRLLSQRHIATKKQPPFNYLRKAANEQLQNVEASNRLLAQYLGVIYYRFRLSKPIRRPGRHDYKWMLISEQCCARPRRSAGFHRAHCSSARWGGSVTVKRKGGNNPWRHHQKSS